MKHLATIEPQTGKATRLEPLSIRELRLLISAANRDGKNQNLSEILTILSTTGLRTGELARIRWADVDFEHRTIAVHPPNSGKPRSVPVGPRLGTLLKARQDRLAGSELLIGTRPERFVHWLRGRLVTLADDHLAERRLSPSTLRHSFASVWMLLGGNIDSLMAVMGWKRNFVGRCPLPPEIAARIAAEDQMRVEKALLEN